MSGRLVAMAPATQGALMGLLAFVSVLAIFLAVRKVRENEIFCDELRQAQLARKRERLSARRVDVFAPLRAPGEPVPPDDVRRILVACAAEGRCVAKHVRRAQTTLSVEDYGDELELAGRKLDAVIRCVEALTDRLQGHETGRGGLMKAYVTICTDSLVICQAKPVEARSTMEALLAALHHETSAFAHLRDLPLARLHIEVWPEGDHFKTATLNQEAGNA